MLLNDHEFSVIEFYTFHHQVTLINYQWWLVQLFNIQGSFALNPVRCKGTMCQVWPDDEEKIVKIELKSIHHGNFLPNLVTPNLLATEFHISAEEYVSTKDCADKVSQYQCCPRRWSLCVVWQLQTKFLSIIKLTILF